MGKSHRFGRIGNKLGLFRRDQRGNVAVIVGAAIIPLVGALGLATDTARGYLVKARLSQALDAATLAGGKVYFSTQRDADIKKYFAANFPSTTTPVYDVQYNASFMDAQVTLHTPVNGGVQGKENLTIKAEATVPTTFMRVLGFQTVTVDATSQVTRAISALDTVISMDFSGSMASPTTKITSARDAAITFVNDVFGTNTTSPQLTVDGVTYNLLNIGFVPWNSKTRVTTLGQSFTSSTSSLPAGWSKGAFTDPVTGAAGTLWKANNSEVPLLQKPENLPGGWSGCVYARYLGDQYNDDAALGSDDADTVRGQVQVGSGASMRQWYGWEPMAVDDAEPRSGNWGDNSANNNGPGSSSRWIATATYKTKNCNNAYFTDISTTSYDNADGSIKTTAPNSTTNSSRPAAVPNPLAAAGSSYTEWTSSTASVTKKYSGFMHFIDPTKSYLLPGSGASGDAYYPNPGSADCTACLVKGIIPLTTVKATIVNQLSTITGSDPTGNTNIEQGLYWAWEVLMPGVPFDQAVVTVPFKRTRAIILLTDGEQVGGPGDAYKGRFGFNTNAGLNSDAGHGKVKVGGVLVQNNLDNRARQLAENIRNEGIKLYVIGFDLAGNTHALTFLQSIASAPDENGNYFFDAPNPSDLDAVFKQIAASLSNLRISM
jgi:Flp pilus assembly protein TadG